MQRTSKARARLDPGLTKPKRMRHETFLRLGTGYLEARKELRAGQEDLAEDQERIKYDL